MVSPTTSLGQPTLMCMDRNHDGGGIVQNTRRMFNIDGEREQANWDMAAILELQSVPFSFRKKTGGAAYCKKIIESMCVKLR